MSLFRPLAGRALGGRPLAGRQIGSDRTVTPGKGVGWSPLSLFANGESGFIIDPTIANVSQDTAGTTPVTADGDPVGRVLDASGKGNHATRISADMARPAWKSADDPYLLFDGGTDQMATTFLPTSAITVAAAWRVTDISVTRFALGGGVGGGVSLVQIGTAGTSGKPQLALGNAQMPNAAYGSWVDLDKCVVLTTDGTNWSAWIDGALAYSAAISGAAPTGTKGLGIGCTNENSFTGTRLLGRFYAGLALNRVATDAEMACISQWLYRRSH